MQMLNKGTAQLDWRMVGSIGPLPVDIKVVSVIEMNLLTGRIVNQRCVTGVGDVCPQLTCVKNIQFMNHNCFGNTRRSATL